MPNTLAHIAVNGLVLNSLFRNTALLWVYISCVIPDFPWIVQRIVKLVDPAVNTYDLRMYTIAQSSWFMCIILSLAIASLCHQYLRVVVVLASGCLLHLLLDSTQMKWGNGVHLFAPFSWTLLEGGWYWPESWITITLSLLGLVFYFTLSKSLKIGNDSLPVFELHPRRIGIFLLCALVYIILPVYYFSEIEASNSHYVKTMKDRDARVGKYVEIDRASFIIDDGKKQIRASIGNEIVDINNIVLDEAGMISIKGEFMDKHTIRISDYHVHHAWFRDAATYVGLLLILSFMLTATLNEFKQRKIRN